MSENAKYMPIAKYQGGMICTAIMNIMPIPPPARRLTI